MEKKISILKIAIFILTVYFTVETVINGYYLISTYVAYKQKLEELNALKLENQKLKEDIKYAKTDEFIEKFARENYCLGKPNETIIYFKFQDNQTEISQNHDNFLKNLLKLFKK